MHDIPPRLQSYGLDCAALYSWQGQIKSPLQIGSRAHLDSFLEGTGIVSPELKQLELETNYIPPSNEKVKK